MNHAGFLLFSSSVNLTFQLSHCMLWMPHSLTVFCSRPVQHCESMTRHSCERHCRLALFINFSFLRAFLCVLVVLQVYMSTLWSSSATQLCYISAFQNINSTKALHCSVLAYTCEDHKSLSWPTVEAKLQSINSSMSFLIAPLIHIQLALVSWWCHVHEQIVCYTCVWCVCTHFTVLVFPPLTHYYSVTVKTLIPPCGHRVTATAVLCKQHSCISSGCMLRYGERCFIKIDLYYFSPTVIYDLQCLGKKIWTVE